MKLNKFIKKIIKAYFNLNIHIGISIVCISLLNSLVLHTTINKAFIVFIFTGTIFSYNFIKYYSVKKSVLKKIHIAFLNICCLIISIFLFIQMNFYIKISLLWMILLVFFYTISLKSKNKNFRNTPYLKTYIIAFCWAFTSVIIPQIDRYDELLNYILLIRFFEIFIFIIILLIMFDIQDIYNDPHTLKTIPQIVGINKSKWIGILLLLIVIYIEKIILKQPNYILLVGLICLIFLIKSAPTNNPYYTICWVESIPIFWYFIHMFCTKWCI